MIAASGKLPDNGSALLQNLAYCQDLWRRGIGSEWFRALEVAQYSSSSFGKELAARQKETRWRRQNVGFFEAYLWVQCVPDADYNDFRIPGGRYVSPAGHRDRIYVENKPSCWLQPQHLTLNNASCFVQHCKACRYPLHRAFSYHFSVFHWQTLWDVDIRAPPGDAAQQSRRATRHLQGYIHSTHNRGPFHWVPFLEMFDWLFLQWNPKSYQTNDKMMRTVLFLNYPLDLTLPFVGGFLVRLRNPPRAIFITIPLLPYFVRYVMPFLPQKVAIYVGRGFQDAVVPRQWLRELAGHPRIMHVFAENPQNRLDGVTSMPIGMDPVFLQRESSVPLSYIAGSVQLDGKIIDRVVGGHAVIGPIRRAAKDYMLSTPWCDWIVTKGEHGERQLAYWAEVVKYAFILSPPAVYHGIGPTGGLVDTDSYRTMEALILGTIPILWDGPNAWPWNGLPVVKVTDWSQVTPANLRKWWQELRPLLEGDRPYLRSSYWWGKIERVINSSERALHIP